MQPNTCSPKHIYRISTYTKREKLKPFIHAVLSYTRGIFNLAYSGYFVAYEGSIDASDLDIFIEGCPVDHSDAEPWMGNCNEGFFDSLDQYLTDGCVVCELCETKLHAKSLF